MNFFLGLGSIVIPLIVGILIITGFTALQEASPQQATVSFNKDTYRLFDSASIRVIDGTGSGQTTVTIKITTTNDPVGFEIIIPEIAPDAGIFEIIISINSLSVSVGDIITVEELISGNTDTAVIVESDISLTGMKPFHASFDSDMLIVDKFFKLKIEFNNEDSTSFSVPIEYTILEDTGTDFVEIESQIENVFLNPGENSVVFPQQNSLIVDGTNFCIRVTLDQLNSLTVCPEIKETRQLRIIFVPISLTASPTSEYPDCDSMNRIATLASEYIQATFPVADQGENEFIVVDVSCENTHSYPVNLDTSFFPEDVVDALETEMWNFGQPDDSSYDLIVGVWHELAITRSLCGAVWGLNNHAVLVGENCVNHPTAHEIAHNLKWAKSGQPPPLPGSVQCPNLSFSHICELDSPGHWIDKQCDMGKLLRLDNTCDPNFTPVDFMSPGGTSTSNVANPVSRWVSGATWEYLANVLDFSCPFNFLKLDICNPDPPLIGIRGIVTEDGSTFLKPWYKFDGKPDLLLDNPGRYRIQYFDSQGTQLAETGFASLGFDVHDGSGPGVLNMKIPDVQGTSQIIIKDGETVLFDRIFSENIPTVTITSPQGNEIFEPGETVSVKWNSFDADGDSLIFSIYLSKDNGQTWTPVVSELTENQFEFVLPTNRLSSNLLIRVIATDGVNTAEDISDSTFSVTTFNEIPIDIKPGSEQNPINCNNQNGKLPVAILSTNEFDATTVDHTTVKFGKQGIEAEEAHKKGNIVKRHEEDVNGDNLTDLMFHFDKSQTQLGCDDTQGVLKGLTFGGEPIRGTDEINPVGENNPDKPENAKEEKPKKVKDSKADKPKKVKDPKPEKVKKDKNK